MSEQEKPKVFERHLQTILTSLAVLLLGWVGFTILELRDASVIQSVQITGIVEDIQEIKLGTRALWTRRDHDLYADTIDQRFKEIDRRLESAGE